MQYVPGDDIRNIDWNIDCHSQLPCEDFLQKRVDNLVAVASPHRGPSAQDGNQLEIAAEVAAFDVRPDQ